jgi:hypothetical protein
MLDATDLPERPTPALTAAIAEALVHHDHPTLQRLTRCSDQRLAVWAAVAHRRMQDPAEPISARMTARDWLAANNLRHLLPEHLPAAAVRAGFRLDGRGGVSGHE